MRYSRVILLGFPKNGNTTIHNALLHMGYDFFQHKEDLDFDIEGTPYESGRQALYIPENTGIALGTLGILSHWRMYVERYPDALYVLNTRPQGDYLRSLWKAAWFAYTNETENSWAVNGNWPPTAHRGYHRLANKAEHESNIATSNIPNLHIADITQTTWVSRLVQAIDSEYDNGAELQTVYTYTGFDKHNQNYINNLHSNSRPNSVLDSHSELLINLAVEESIYAYNSGEVPLLPPDAA